MYWFLERPSGLRTVGSGPQGWEQLGLDHDDVTRPGRIRTLGFMDDRQRQTILTLRPNETLKLVVRRTVMTGPGTPPPPTLLLGIEREDGSGLYAIVQPDGNLILTSDFDHA